MIHETAIIDPSTILGSHVTVGPYAVIGPHCTIGDNTSIGAHVVIGMNCTIGERNRIYPHAIVAEDPQDLKYSGEETFVEIGDDNIIREFVTISRGTAEGGGKTVLGNGNLAMAYSHIAHDCILGSSVIMANCATLGGHVTIHDHVVIGGLTGIHQFVRIGAHAIVGALSGVGKDIPPYVMAAPTRDGKKAIFGLNIVGLKRRGFQKDTLGKIKEAVKLMSRTDLTVEELIRTWEEKFSDSEEIQYMAKFFRESTRGVERV